MRKPRPWKAIMGGYQPVNIGGRPYVYGPPPPITGEPKYLPANIYGNPPEGSPYWWRDIEGSRDWANFQERLADMPIEERVAMWGLKPLRFRKGYRRSTTGPRYAIIGQTRKNWRRKTAFKRRTTKPYKRFPYRRRRGARRYRKSITYLPKQRLGGLTRGTSQVNPIFHHSEENYITIDGSAHLDFTQIRLPAYAATKKRSTLNLVTAFEILKVTFFFEPVSIGNGAVAATNAVVMSLMTKEPSTTTMTEFHDDLIVCEWSQRYPWDGAGGPTCTYNKWQQTVDLTDDCGHGFIVVANDLWLRCYTNDWQNHSTTKYFYCMIQYRYKNVGKGDYIGTRFVQRR